MADARIRYFCLVMPNGRAQLGHDYLKALDETELGVKACPIGAAFLMQPPWDSLVHLFFIGQNDKKFCNIVCAPPNLLLGAALKAVDVKPPRDLGVASEFLTPSLLDKTPPDKNEVVYRPQTALSGLFTVGVKNVAITMARTQVPDEHEVRALQQYDIVITPTETDAELLRKTGVTTICVPPDKAQLKKLVSMLLGLS